MAGISKSQVSRLCAEIDERVRTFLERPIEGDWPYLWIDATYVKVREAGRIVSVAVTIAVAVNTDGRREVLGMAIGASEAETFWIEFLRRLKRRGLAGVKLVISDAHEGIKAAVARVFRATWQRCRVHFMRNALAHAGKSGRRVVESLDPILISAFLGLSTVTPYSIGLQVGRLGPDCGALDLCGVDIRAAPDDEIRPAVVNEQFAIGIARTHIARMYPPSAQELLGRLCIAHITICLSERSDPENCKNTVFEIRIGKYR